MGDTVSSNRALFEVNWGDEMYTYTTPHTIQSYDNLQEQIDDLNKKLEILISLVEERDPELKIKIEEALGL